MQIRILYQDPDVLAVDKPAGVHIHTPEGGQHRISRNVHLMQSLEKQLGQKVYNIHRIDRATSGVVLCALSSGVAKILAKQFEERTVKKSYIVLCRGSITQEALIERPLKKEEIEYEARTLIQPICQIEIPIALSKYPTTRFSLVETFPLTGRMHQIRRHLAGLGHPIVGDSIYGSGAINRYFKTLKIEGLCLKAQSIEFTHPSSGERIKIDSRWTGKWHKIFDWIGVCAWQSHRSNSG